VASKDRVYGTALASIFIYLGLMVTTGPIALFIDSDLWLIFYLVFLAYPAAWLGNKADRAMTRLVAWLTK